MIITFVLCAMASLVGTLFGFIAGRYQRPGGNPIWASTWLVLTVISMAGVLNNIEIIADPGLISLSLFVPMLSPIIGRALDEVLPSRFLLPKFMVRE